MRDKELKVDLDKKYKKAYELIFSSYHIVISSHINPDGDTLGSMLGLGIALQKMGKRITYHNSEKTLPKKFDFLPSYQKIKYTLYEKYDLFICVDAASFERLGIKEEINAPSISFDHHKTNRNFCTINIVNPNSISTSLVIFDFLEACKIPLQKESAICLYTALIEDSGFFKFDRVDDKTFKKAAKLVEFGANPSQISNLLTNRNSLAKIRLMQRYLDSITLKNSATICISRITLEDFIQTGATKSDSDDFVNIGLSLATVKLSIFCYEMDYENIKFSLRSKGDEIDCSSIAQRYGGGGHKRAAGFTAKINKFDDIIQLLIGDTRELL